MDIIGFFDSTNPALWWLSNILLGYTALAVLTFVVAYYVLFDPSATTGGKLIFRFMASLAGVLGLVFLGVYVDPVPNYTWYVYPEGIDWWRPALRLVIYVYLAYSVTSLAVFLAIRKWWPEKVKTAPEMEIVKVRHPTTENTVVRHPDTDSIDLVSH